MNRWLKTYRPNLHWQPQVLGDKKLFFEKAELLKSFTKVDVSFKLRHAAT